MELPGFKTVLSFNCMIAYRSRSWRTTYPNGLKCVLTNRVQTVV